MINNQIIDIKIWQNVPGLPRLIDAIYSDQAPARIVGGAVRDTLRGIICNDIDIATPLRPQTIMKKLEAANIKSIPTGLQHGTITAVSDGHHFEVTTLRKDIETDGRHAIVEFSDDWREDAMRRDFTINALYADPITGEIFDYFDGMKDLENHCIRFIGDAHDRIEEDHLRILRYFRFLARFDQSHINAQSLAACRELTSRQMTLARERINDELMKILAVQYPYSSIELAYNNAIFSSFLPEINQASIDNLRELITREQNHDIKPLALRRFAALIKNTPQSADKIASRLKFSNAMRKSLIYRLSEQEIETEDYKRLAFQYGKEIAIDQILLHCKDNDIGPNLAKIQSWNIPQFTMTGGDLIERGLSAGPIISAALQQIKNDWIKAGFPDQTALENIADKRIKQYS